MSQLLLSRVEVFDALLNDVPILIADLADEPARRGEILLASTAADELFGVAVKGSLVGRKLSDVLPGIPADYSAHPRKTSVIAYAPGGEASGLVLALTPRQFTGRAGPCVIVVITEVKSPGPAQGGG